MGTVALENFIPTKWDPGNANEASPLAGVTVNTSRKKILTSKYLLGNNYSAGIFLIVEKYFLPELSTPLGIVWCVVFHI